MSGNLSHLIWKDFVSNKSSTLTELFKESSFSDVTLVSDDNQPFLAHRYVLSTHSPYFKDILLNNPHPHPLIYLKNVNHEDLHSILEFIYLGKASVYPDNMGRFALAAKDLQIKKLADNIRFGYQSNQRNQEVENDTNQNSHDNH